MKSWLHYRRPKWDLEEQEKRSVEIIYILASFIYWYWKRGLITFRDFEAELAYRILKDWAGKRDSPPFWGWKIIFLLVVHSQKTEKTLQVLFSQMLLDGQLNRERKKEDFILLLHVLYHFEIMRTLWIYRNYGMHLWGEWHGQTSSQKRISLPLRNQSLAQVLPESLSVPNKTVMQDILEGGCDPCHWRGT